MRRGGRVLECDLLGWCAAIGGVSHVPLVMFPYKVLPSRVDCHDPVLQQFCNKVFKNVLPEMSIRQVPCKYSSHIVFVTIFG